MFHLQTGFLILITLTFSHKRTRGFSDPTHTPSHLNCLLWDLANIYLGTRLTRDLRRSAFLQLSLFWHNYNFNSFPYNSLIYDFRNKAGASTVCN